MYFCLYTYHDVTDFEVDGMVRNIKCQISLKHEITPK